MIEPHGIIYHSICTDIGLLIQLKKLIDMKRSSQKIQVSISTTSDEAWQIIGAVSGVDLWLKGLITSCRVEGDKRICGTENGEFIEDIRKVDHENRELHYSIPEQNMLPINNIEGQMTVLGDENGEASIEWSWIFDVNVGDELNAKQQLAMLGEMGIKGIEALVLSRKNNAA